MSIIDPHAQMVEAINTPMPFGKYAGTAIKVDGEELLVMREDDIVAVIEA